MTFVKQTVRDVPLKHKTVLVRADYNVPLDKKGRIADDLRIRASLPTLEYLVQQGCKVVIIAHLGRPEGREARYSLKPVAKRLKKLLGKKITFVDDCKGDKVRMAIKRAPVGAVLLLENLRYYNEEKANDEAFARQVAASVGAQYFVQDGFGVVHRAHASTSAITHYLPSVAGLLLEKEYEVITEAMAHPKRPFVAVLGGAKVSDKLPLIEALIPKADAILIGGAMANTFLATAGLALGKSRVEPGQEGEIRAIYQKAVAKVGIDKLHQFIQLPSDLAVGATLDGRTRRKNVGLSGVDAEHYALDIGDATIERYAKVVASAKTVIWNGTLGYAELPAFAHGSARVALELATHRKITSIVGGGDTADFVLGWDAKHGGSFSHVSTGGGASLELMSGKKLPGVEVLLDARGR